MVREGYTPEQGIGKLREVEVHQGHTIREAAGRTGVSDPTYYLRVEEGVWEHGCGAGQEA